MGLAVDIGLPGMAGVATSSGSGGWLHVHRTGVNAWRLVATCDDDVAEGLTHHDGMPGSVLRRASGAFGEGQPPDHGRHAVLASVELDRCGTWITLSNAGGPRPVVVRRAGWVDVRGHPAAPLGRAGDPPLDDRVGLGPGDALVLFGPEWMDATGDGAVVSELVLDTLIGVAGADPAVQISALRSAELAPHGAELAVLAVPPHLGDDPLTRIYEATGTVAGEVELPGYPLGDEQPDLWSVPPRPPRLARLHVADAGALAEVRELLRRLLASWRIADQIAGEQVELLATEVIGNAIVHSGTAATVIVRYLGDRVRVEVGDGSRELPSRRERGADQIGGWGLQLVEALSSAWGVLPTAEGKRVWFEVTVASPGVTPLIG